MIVYNIELILRFSQFVFGLIAMSCISSAFRVVNGYQLGSPDFNFLFLLNFCIWVYSLIYIMRYYILNRELISSIFIICSDLAFSICLMIGGITGSLANIYKDCDKLSNVSCGSLTTGIVFNFMNMLLFLTTFCLIMYKENYQKNEYIIQTPRNLI